MKRARSAAFGRISPMLLACLIARSLASLLTLGYLCALINGQFTCRHTNAPPSTTGNEIINIIALTSRSNGNTSAPRWLPQLLCQEVQIFVLHLANYSQACNRFLYLSLFLFFFFRSLALLVRFSLMKSIVRQTGKATA